MTSNDQLWPGEDRAYRDARNALLEAELALREQVERVAALRRELPPGGLANDYLFEGASGPISLVQLFGDHDTLIVYSYMFGADASQPCPMCTAYLDSVEGSIPHIERRARFAVVARSPLDRLLKIRAARGWRNLNLYSAAGNDYQRDYHGETSEGEQLPMCNVFVKAADGVRHFWGSEMLFARSPWAPRHLDLLWPLWHHFDLTPDGRGDFMPSLSYTAEGD